MGFYSSQCRGIRPYLRSRGNSLSFPLAAGNSWFLSSCDGDLGIRLAWQQESQDSLELRWGSRVSSQFAAGESGLLWSCSRNPGFFSSCCWKLRVPRELPQGTESSSRTAAKNQCSSEFAAQDAGFHWIPLDSWNGILGSP